MRENPGVPSIDAFLDLVGQLPEVERADRARWSQFDVRGQRFGYLWEPTVTVGLKQTIAEQLALVGERPDAFEVQFTAYGFGWVVVHLERVERDELAELVFEAWRLSAPADRAAARAARPRVGPGPRPEVGWCLRSPRRSRPSRRRRPGRPTPGARRSSTAPGRPGAP